MKKVFYVLSGILVAFNLYVAQDSEQLKQVSSDIVIMSDDELIGGDH